MRKFSVVFGKRMWKLSQSDQICELIKKMLEGRTTGKATIKLEVEFSKYNYSKVAKSDTKHKIEWY